jgi:hypothetical protein
VCTYCANIVPFLCRSIILMQQGHTAHHLSVHSASFTCMYSHICHAMPVQLRGLHISDVQLLRAASIRNQVRAPFIHAYTHGPCQRSYTQYYAYTDVTCIYYIRMDALHVCTRAVVPCQHFTFQSVHAYTCIMYR